MSTLLLAFIGNRHLSLDGINLSEIDSKKPKEEKRTFRELTQELHSQYDQIKDRLDLNILDRVLLHTQYGKDITDVVLFASDQSGLEGAPIGQDTLFAGEILQRWLPNEYAPKHLKRQLRVKVIFGRKKSAVNSDDWFRLLKNYLPDFAQNKYKHCTQWIAVDAGGTSQQKFALKSYLEYAAPIDNWMLLDVPNHPKQPISEQQQDEYRRLITLSQIEKLIQRGHFQSALNLFNQSFNTSESDGFIKSEDLQPKHRVLTWLVNFEGVPPRPIKPSTNVAKDSKLEILENLEDSLSQVKIESTGQSLSAWECINMISYQTYPFIPRPDPQQLPMADSPFILFVLQRHLILARYFYDCNNVNKSILSLHYFMETYPKAAIELRYPESYPFVSEEKNYQRYSDKLMKAIDGKQDNETHGHIIAPIEQYNEGKPENQQVSNAGMPLHCLLAQSYFKDSALHQEICQLISQAISWPGLQNEGKISSLRNKIAHTGLTPTKEQLDKLNPSLETLLTKFEEAFSLKDKRPLQQMVELVSQYLFYR